VQSERRPLWRVRLAGALTRYVVWAVALTGVAATARFAISPPRSARVEVRVPSSDDPAAAGFAVLFARRYLTWDSAHPEGHQQGLQGFLGDTLDPDGGFQPPASGAQRVTWAEVVQVRPGSRQDRVFTVATETDRSGLLYLAVDVARDRGGGLRLAGYPAFVGAPMRSTATLEGDASLRDVEDAGLSGVVARCLRNYLAGSRSNLAADLAAGARVTVPAQPLSLTQVTTLKWTPGGGSVLAQIRAEDRAGAAYALRYELDVVNVSGRWEIAAIEVDPGA
jgi:hypothetical protein